MYTLQFFNFQFDFGIPETTILNDTSTVCLGGE